MTTKIDPNFTDTTVKACMWKNLHFTKDGTSFCGTAVYISEERAREGVERQLQDDYGVTDAFVTPDGVRYPWWNYSHTIQIPWSK